MTDSFDRWPDENWSERPPGADLQQWSSNRPGKGYKPPRAPKRNRGIGRVLIVFAFIVCMVVLVAAVIGGMKLIQGRSETESTSTTTAGVTATIVVKSGMGALQVGRLLEESGVVDSSSEFVDLVKARGSENSLKPGSYKFTTGGSLLSVVEALEKGSGSSLKVTIPEGMAADQVSALLTKGGNIDGDSYEALAAKPSKFILPEVGGETPDVDSLEGLLFPSTYFLTEGDGATELIGAQLAAFEVKTASLPWSKAETLGVTPYEIVIIASMIEKEANIADERAKVSAVIYNRLKQKMALGIDATVRYALGKWTGALTETDLKVDSPYNTRVNKGLPPAPISNPGVAALKAALEPANVDYLYYVLIDTDGHHFFTASYEEFLQAKENAPEQ